MQGNWALRALIPNGFGVSVSVTSLREAFGIAVDVSNQLGLRPNIFATYIKADGPAARPIANIDARIMGLRPNSYTNNYIKAGGLALQLTGFEPIILP